MKKCYLVLADGHIFEGFRFGAEGDTIGELVFNTGMVGYEETLTDPNNFGQIVLQTFPMIGNYGIIPADLEGKKAHLSGYVVREYCTAPSNFRCEKTLDEYLKEQGVVGIYGVDTREITRILRDKGVMAARIVDEVTDLTADGLETYSVAGAPAAVAIGEKTVLCAQGEKKYTVSLFDLGTKASFAAQLTRRGCEVHVFPFDASAEELLSVDPDGIFLTDGPGDPADADDIAAEVGKLLGKKPLFGVGLGHQLTAIAAGGKTAKLTYGHRGGNQPVKQLEDGRTFITAQNHGYEVLGDALPEGASVSFVNVNDQSCEGADYPALNAFSVQFHPTECKGPQDTTFLYERFIQLMTASKKQ